MDEDTDPQEEHEEQEEQVEQVESEVAEVEEPKQVPLSALQKERKKRQDSDAARMRSEVELQYLKEQAAKAVAPVEDETLYESATKADLTASASQVQQSTLRQVHESLWLSQNPEKAEYVNEHLEDFLRTKPNLRLAIAESLNRYDEAYTLMTALNPKQKEAPKVARKTAGSPVGVPKAAALNEAVDVMSMNDTEYRAWRADRKRRR
ncbi:MAG: hypothetical protein Q8O94_03490 [bacterium]|nr:hypothetical protein [bacterium]